MAFLQFDNECDWIDRCFSEWENGADGSGHMCINFVATASHSISLNFQICYVRSAVAMVADKLKTLNEKN